VNRVTAGGRPLADAVGYDARADRPVDGADHIVDLAGDVQKAHVVGDAQGLDAGDLVLADLDGVDLAHEGFQGVQPQVAHGSLVAHHGHGLRVKGSLQLLVQVFQAGVSLCAVL